MKRNGIKIIAGLLISALLPFEAGFAAGGRTNLSPALEIHTREMMHAFWQHNSPRIISARHIGQFNPAADKPDDHFWGMLGQPFYVYGTVTLELKMSKDKVEDLFDEQGGLRMGVWTSSSAKKGAKVKVVQVLEDGKTLWERPWIEVKKKEVIINIAEGIKKIAQELIDENKTIDDVEWDSLIAQFIVDTKLTMLTKEELCELLRKVMVTIKLDDLKEITADKIILIMQEAGAYRGQIGNEFRLEREVFPLEIPAYADVPEKNGFMEFSVYFYPRDPQSGDAFRHTTGWQTNGVMKIVPCGEVGLSPEQRLAFYNDLWLKYEKSKEETERIKILGILLFYAIEQKDAPKELNDKIKGAKPDEKKQIIADLEKFSLSGILPFLVPLLKTTDKGVSEQAKKVMVDLASKEQLSGQAQEKDNEHSVSGLQMLFDFCRERYIDMSGGEERITYLVVLIDDAFVKNNEYAGKILEAFCLATTPAEIRRRFAEDLSNFEAQKVSGLLYRLLHDNDEGVRAAAWHTYRELEKKMFLYAVVHHIRNRLFSIGGNVRLIKRRLQEKNEAGLNKALEDADADIIIKKATEMERIITEAPSYISLPTINMAVDSLVTQLDDPMSKTGESIRGLNGCAGIEGIKNGRELMSAVNTEFTVVSGMFANLKGTIGINQAKPGLQKMALNEVLGKCCKDFKAGLNIEELIKKGMNGLAIDSEKRQGFLKIVEEELEKTGDLTQIDAAVQAIMLRVEKELGLREKEEKYLKSKKEDLSARLSRIMKARDIKVELSIPAGSPVEALASEELGEIIKAMLDNSLKAHAQKITVSVKRRSLGKVEISIKDDGHGMGPYEKLFAFSPFFTTQTYKTSFTLRRVKQILESYGGKISLFARENGKNGERGGAEFVIELPAMEGNEITVAEIIRLQQKLKNILERTDSLLKIQGSQQSDSEAAKEDAEKTLIRDYQESAKNLLEKIERYQIGDFSFKEIMDIFKRLRLEFIAKYSALEEISETEDNFDLKNSAAEAMNIFLGILVSAFRTTEDCSIMEVINEVANFYRSQFKDIKLNFSGIIERGLENTNVFIPKTALRKILSDFFVAARENGADDAGIGVSLEGRELKVQAKINGNTGFNGDNFLFREKEVINVANGRTEIDVSTDEKVTFSLWLPIKTDLKTLPCRQFRFSKKKRQVIVLFGDAGTNRTPALDYLAAVLGGKAENVGFLMRVLAYYLIEEHPGWVKEIGKLAAPKDIKDIEGKEKLDALLVEKVVPYVNTFLKEEARVNMDKDPWLIKNLFGEWIDSAVGSEGRPSLRNQIKEKTNRDDYMRFFYSFSNHPEIKKIVEGFALDDGIKAMETGMANCVVIKSTDAWKIEPLRQDRLGINVTNVFLHAPLEVRAANAIYWGLEDILGRDALKDGTNGSLEEKQEKADLSLLVTGLTGRLIGDEVINFLIGHNILKRITESNSPSIVDADTGTPDYDKSVVFLPELAI
ncbi:MAG: ATP-binding protein [Candidatus Omnitrophica bacterium]|nr:ATP-binding protein [Candidatus Omnitrophota bacterium]MBU4478616.1 ATP-binding protein [Candidatus Omnitrophota bacterium]